MRRMQNECAWFEQAAHRLKPVLCRLAMESFLSANESVKEHFKNRGHAMCMSNAIVAIASLSKYSRLNSAGLLGLPDQFWKEVLDVVFRPTEA